MRWVSRDPPIYVWSDDEWYNVRDKKTYDANIEDRFWMAQGSSEKIDFPEKCKVMKDEKCKVMKDEKCKK